MTEFFLDLFRACDGVSDLFPQQLAMALPHPLLVWLHHELSAQMATPGFYQTGPTGISGWHSAYLVVNAVQLAGGLVFVVQSLKAWRAEDANPQAG